MSNFQPQSRATLGGAPLPSTPLGDAMARGISDSGRTGNSFEVTSGPPRVVLETVNGFDYLVDLRPGNTSGRNIELNADPVYSSQVTVVAAYRAADQGERNNNPGVGDGFYVSTPLRDFRAQITFGTGSAQHSVECDISEGIAMSLPCQSVTLAVYSTFYQRLAVPGFSSQAALQCQAHLASGMATKPGQCTDRVFTPYQAPLDLLDPPTIEQWIERLNEALCQRQIFAGIEGPPG
jgi:hypothetical protein